MSNTKHTTLRAALRAKYGARRYRIVGTAMCETVEVYGAAPNSNTVCWWRLGSISEARLWLGIEDADAAKAP